jgi:phage baseplate assembly protein W
MISELFPTWASRIEYLNVEALSRWEPERTLSHIESGVGKLLQSLRRQEPDPSLA